MKPLISPISIYKIYKRRKEMEKEILLNINTRIRTIENTLELIKDKLTMVQILQSNVTTIQNELNSLKHRRIGGNNNDSVI